MIRVDNRRAVRRLALRSLRAARSRNLIAVAAIALTTALFCALFTIALTLLHTVEEETFRQVGTDAHGGLKNMTEAQMQELTADDRIVESGGRLMLGAGGRRSLPQRLRRGQLYGRDLRRDELLHPDHRRAAGRGQP